jgi:hypothetical protein
MYYVLAATIALLIFILFIKALGVVVKGILTTIFVLIIFVSLFVMYKSTQGPVDLFGVYRVDKFEVTRFGD